MRFFDDERAFVGDNLRCFFIEKLCRANRTLIMFFFAETKTRRFFGWDEHDVMRGKIPVFRMAKLANSLVRTSRSPSGAIARFGMLRIVFANARMRVVTAAYPFAPIVPVGCYCDRKFRLRLFDFVFVEVLAAFFATIMRLGAGSRAGGGNLGYQLSVIMLFAYGFGVSYLCVSLYSRHSPAVSDVIVPVGGFLKRRLFRLCLRVLHAPYACFALFVGHFRYYRKVRADVKLYALIELYGVIPAVFKCLRFFGGENSAFHIAFLIAV